MNKEEYKNIFENEYSHWWYRILDDLVEYYVKIYNHKNSINILDAGCGTGRIISKLSKYGNTFGIDASPTAIEICQSKGLTNVRIADLNEWQSEKEFDVIISLDVLYHQSFINIDKIIKSFHNSLRSNGVLILNLPAFNALKRQHDIVVGGNKRFRMKDIERLLVQNGFNVFTKSYRYPLLFKFILLRKLFFNKNNKVSSDLEPVYQPLDKLLYLVHKLENEIIKMGFSIPYGSSLFIVAKKSENGQNSKDYTLAYVKNDIISKVKVYIKSKTFLNQLFRYSIVGVLNTILGLSAIYLLYNFFHFDYIVSNIGGYFVGLVNGFIWNKKWTFESSKHFSKEIVPFLIVFGISYAVNLVIIILMVETFKIDPNIAQILGIAAYSSTNFLVNKYWTFSKVK